MLEIKICVGSSCHLKGSYNVINEFQHLIEEKALHDKIDIKATFCMKQCQKNGVAVEFCRRRRRNFLKMLKVTKRAAF